MLRVRRTSCRLQASPTECDDDDDDDVDWTQTHIYTHLISSFSLHRWLISAAEARRPHQTVYTNEILASLVILYRENEREREMKSSIRHESVCSARVLSVRETRVSFTGVRPLTESHFVPHALHRWRRFINIDRHIDHLKLATHGTCMSVNTGRILWPCSRNHRTQVVLTAACENVPWT